MEVFHGCESLFICKYLEGLCFLKTTVMISTTIVSETTLTAMQSTWLRLTYWGLVSKRLVIQSCLEMLASHFGKRKCRKRLNGGGNQFIIVIF